MRRSRIKGKERRRGGFSLLEVLIVAAILGFLARALVETANSMSRLTSSGNAQVSLQEQGQKAMTAIIDDLRRSGFTVLAGKSYPYVFDDGNPDGAYGDHEHDVPDHGDAGGGDDLVREVIFVQPADEDGDGRPDVDMDLGEVVWSTDEISFRVFRRGGVNQLERSVNAGDNRVVARQVDRVVFDTPASSNWEIPLGSVRVRLFLSRNDSTGTEYDHQTEVVVKLRNGADV